MTENIAFFEPDPEECEQGYAYLNITDPLIAWLVYRGELVSAERIYPSALSVWATRYLQDAEETQPSDRYAAELVIEQIRVTNYPEAVSRLRGLYVFPDRISALEAASRWNGPFRPEFLVELGIRPGSRMSRHDAEWITTRLGRTRLSVGRTLTFRARPLGQAPSGSCSLTVEYGS